MAKQTETDRLALIARAQAGDVEARNEMVRTNMGLVFRVANGYLRYARSFDVEDLEQEGVFGLMRAVETFNASLGFKWSTYAVRNIRFRIYKYLQANSRSIRLTPRMAENATRIAALAEQKGRSLSEADMLAAFPIPSGSARLYMRTARHLSRSSFDICAVEGNGAKRPRYEYETEPGSESDSIFCDVSKDELLGALTKIPITNRRAVCALYGIGRGQVLARVYAKESGVTRQAVVDRAARGIELLRKLLNVRVEGLRTQWEDS